jgi:RNA polymerase sigma-70 factor (ECF subfamily)
MAQALLRTDSEMAAIYARHKGMLYCVCMTYMKNPADAEDAVQETFFRLIKAGTPFVGAEHEKAWLIRTASNVCKNALQHTWRRRTALSDAESLANTDDTLSSDVFEAVTALPDKYKAVVYLYYYEGYDSAEIARMLEKPPSTVRNYLHDARGILKKQLGDDFCES